jgi:hypothetical protein
MASLDWGYAEEQADGQFWYYRQYLPEMQWFETIQSIVPFFQDVTNESICAAFVRGVWKKR